VAQCSNNNNNNNNNNNTEGKREKGERECRKGVNGTFFQRARW